MTVWARAPNKEDAIPSDPVPPCLVARARTGDQDAWAALHTDAYERLVAFAHHRLGTLDEARDAVSDTMARAVKNIDSFKGDDAGFTPWLFGICRHVIVDALRLRGRFSSAEVPDVASADLDPSEPFLAGEEREMIRAAFARLDEDEQELLRLRVVAGLSSEETAAALGKKPGAIRMAQARALAKLRTFVEEATRAG